ncbi:MAG: N-6 DNA methylase [Bacteroidetes bacterium]|nr:N-6 DNA methylase [Bacteroidota bacterium]
MRLSWNEIRVRAFKFAEKWRDASYEKGETQSFYNDFFGVYGIQRRSVARYEQHVKLLDNRSGYIDLFWPGVLIVEQKSAGRDLEAAKEQAGKYFDSLPETQLPQYILVSDFQTFELIDLDERKTVSFRLDEFPSHVEAFSFIRGVRRRAFKDQDPANIKAAELVGRLHDMLEDGGYRGHDLERLLVRIVFCLFADDTGIFEPRDLFLDYLMERTPEDGSFLGAWLVHLLQVINTPESERMSTMDEDMKRFPYINGALLKGAVRIPSFNSAMRQALIDASLFDWSNISPAIFGALFQSVMDPVKRRELGAHYTSEKNILKVIEPLFMDDLRQEFHRLKSRKDTRRSTELRKFQCRLGQMKFFDPACGCGNFLIIAYRELRRLEIEVLKELYPESDGRRQMEMIASDLSVINVDQFYGIEISEFPARIAETALWMMDHIMNNHLSMEFGHTYTRIPLEAAPHIVHEDALEIDWSKVLPPEECSYILGNPPFGGAKLQSEFQRSQVHRITGFKQNGGTLDYVTAWFFKAGKYIQNSQGRIGFVATNSITHGEQVGQFWPMIFERYHLEIAFAHRTFIWSSDAKGKAHVHVVILGLDHQTYSPANKRLFSYPEPHGEPLESQHGRISPYLFDASGMKNPHLAVHESSNPINGMKKMNIGSQPIDNSYYIFNEIEREQFLNLEPDAIIFMRPYMGAQEFIRGEKRWILALHNAAPNVLSKLGHLRERIAAVKTFREQSSRVSTKKLATTPTLYQVNTIPDTPFLVIPETSSERRDYIPVGWLDPPAIPSNSLKVLTNATLIDFALLTSAMHMAWVRTIAGRLGSSFRYSIGVVYNTFPLPPGDTDMYSLVPLAQAILDARATHENASFAELYDSTLMPPNLRKAHEQLDDAVDKLYQSQGFDSEQARVEYLFHLYEKMLTSHLISEKKKRQ